jgi:hypothetical protein
MISKIIPNPKKAPEESGKRPSAVSSQTTLSIVPKTKQPALQHLQNTKDRQQAAGKRKKHALNACWLLTTTQNQNPEPERTPNVHINPSLLERRPRMMSMFRRSPRNLIVQMRKERRQQKNK